MPQSCTPLGQEKDFLCDASAFCIPRFSTLSLCVVWVLGLVVAVTAGVLADVFQANAPAFPLGPIVNLSLGLNGLCALMSILIGYSLWDSYSFYQPFAGGERYVFLQICGWTTVVSCSILMEAYLLQHQPAAHRYGALTILEVFACSGNIFLVFSLCFFTSSEARGKSGDDIQQQQDAEEERKTSLLKSMLRSPNSESGLVLIFVLVQLFLCNVGVIFRSASWLAMLLFIFFHILCGFLIHVVIKWEHRRGYVLLTGPVETLYFVLSWSLYLAALAGGFALFRNGVDAPQLAFGMTAIAAAVGISLMLVLARTMRRKVDNMPFYAVMMRYARLALSAIAASMVGIAIVIMYYVESRRAEYEGSGKGQAWIDSLLFCQRLVVFFLLILSPVTHLAGCIIYGEAFSFFQPFRGSAGFVVLQALGWSFFAVSILCITFQMTATNFRWILAASATGLMSQFFIQFSIDVFAFSNPSAAESTHGIKDIKPNQKKKGVLNGELILSSLLQLISFILRLVLDIASVQGGSNSFIQKNLLLFFATLGFLVSVPLAHFSGVDKGIQFFRPFQGSGTYVALQSLGWTLYCLFALKSIVKLMESVRDVNSLHLVPERPPMLWLTLEGLIQMLPHLLIVLSIMAEARASISRKRRHCLVMDALALVKVTLEKHLDAHTLHEQVALQKALQTLAQASLSARGILCERRHFQFDGAGAAAAASNTATVVGSLPRIGTIDGDDTDDDFPSFLNGTEAQNRAAELLVLILCVSSATGYIVAARWSSTIPLVGLAFTVAGFAVCTISCVSTHSVYGALLHNRTEMYTFFMPFKGGPVFVALQMAGWASYACTVVATLMHTLGDVESEFTLPTGALFSVSSQLFIFWSIPKFDVRGRRPKYLEENGEGVVAILVFLGAFFFTHFYSHVQRLFSEDGNTDLGVAFLDLNADVYMAATPGRLKLPFFISALSMVVAVPFLLIALNRSARHWVMVAQSPLTNAKNESYFDYLKSDRLRSLFAIVGARAAEIMMLLLSATTPVTFAFSVYYMLHSQQHTIMSILRYLLSLKLLACFIALGLSLAKHIGSERLHTWMNHFWHFFVTCLVYSIALVAVILLCGPALMLPFHSVGAYYTVISSVILTVGATLPPVRMFLRFSIYAVLGYATYLAYLRVLEGETVLSAFVTLQFYAVDVVLLLWWLWYLPSYEGLPEENGTHRSPAFMQWAERYLFANVERYFSFRVIVDDASVNLRDCGNQYIFSFHPHGVFSGTALICTLTNAWREKVGYNGKTNVATHAASIIFNVPLLRDFNLRLGALSVTRSAIVNNLARGNSSIIVTGGQAELLLTESSETVMSLVTYHLGFVRLALRHKLPLVPLLCFAEQNILDILHFRRLQKATLRFLGFPFPIMPYGRWLFPLPNPTPLVLVVGPAVPVPPGASPDNPKDVEAFADLYFSSLKELFYKYRAKAGYPNMELVLSKNR